jgi:hypothetical protein
MSFDILYDTQFIKTADGKIIPMILSGSSNCTQRSDKSGKEVLSRGWGTLICGKKDATWDAKLAWESAELIRHVEEDCAGYAPETQWFRKGGKWLTTSNALVWLKNAIKRARTLEEIRGSLTVGCICWATRKGEQDYVSVEQNAMTCHTTQDLETVLPLLEASRQSAKETILKEMQRRFPGTNPDAIIVTP